MGSQDLHFVVFTQAVPRVGSHPRRNGRYRKAVVSIELLDGRPRTAIISGSFSERIRCLQGPIYTWVLYHRLHHKYYKTDKDPFNHDKGFLYSHYMGNFVVPKVDFDQGMKDIDMRDIDNDMYVWLQYK